MFSSSQADQDIFPRTVCPDGRTFLDIGSNPPTVNNNTYALEKDGWNGICMDLGDLTEQYLANRSAKFICADATNCDWNSILSNMNGSVDYMSFDVDDASRMSFDNFPFDTFRFKTLTIEHDAYKGGNQLELRDYVRYKLISYGYILIFGNVECHGYGAFEDWFVDPKLINRDILIKLLQIRCDNTPSAIIKYKLLNM